VETSANQESLEKLPGYLIMARMGKRVLRPGGRELTRWLLESAGLGPADRVVELAPGVGATAELLLAAGPKSYVGVERDPSMVARASRVIEPRGGQLRRGAADDTGLEPSAATVVVGEAMLTMQPDSGKRAVIAEAARILEPGGRYAIHELCLVPDELDPSLQDEIRDDLSRTIRIGARPLTVADWRQHLEQAGFELLDVRTVALGLLSPRRVVADEGLLGAIRFGSRAARNPAARRRLLDMRRCFLRWRGNVAAVGILARRIGE